MAIEITRCNTIRVRLNTNHIRVTIPAVVTDVVPVIEGFDYSFDFNFE